jgi:hypothetical protein
VEGFNGGAGYGVYGASVNGPGVLGYSQNHYAGQFNGDIYVSGNCTGCLGQSKIDHPLDPANKYLYHSAVQSQDMLNVYNGNVTLDASGEAWVELPEWFEAVNKDMRYQLTPIGAPGPNLHVAEKVKNNRFKIAGGQPGSEVSWQVTGVRNDAYSKANTIPVVEDKQGEERGKYIHPEVFGQPESKGIYNDIRLHHEERIRQSEAVTNTPGR